MNIAQISIWLGSKLQPTNQPGKDLVFALLMLELKRWVVRVTSIWLWTCPLGACQVAVLDNFGGGGGGGGCEYWQGRVDGSLLFLGVSTLWRSSLQCQIFLLPLPSVGMHQGLLWHSNRLELRVYSSWEFLLCCDWAPEVRPGMSDVSLLSGISGLSFDSTLLSPLLFFCLVLLPFLSYLFSVCWSLLLNFFQKILQYFFVKKYAFLYDSCLAARRSWSVVCAACCHMALVFAVMHLYKNIYFFIVSVRSFIHFFKNLVLMNGRNGPRYQLVLALCAFFKIIFLTGVIPKGLILRKVYVWCLCMFCFT